ncbi:MAG: helix-turn-helix transcriptional regulator [Clostridia bacterium]|nr:helix-turn-helix transcriptional regulator [Clostridia bacterium]
MEKKTIGKLISALRRASGMTQRELGERLFVSDKTVSRWERDECTPELSLIPAIAELFGITTDELLRGECNAHMVDGQEEPQEAAARKRVRSEKQFKTMLRHRMIRYKNLSMIAVGISLGGLIAAMIVNLGFLRGMIGFCVGTLFLLAGGICQLCFARSAYLQLEEEDEDFQSAAALLNEQVVRLCVRVIASIVGLFAFMLPIAIFVRGPYYGLNFDSWFPLGILYAALALICYYLVYVFFGAPKLTSRGLLQEDEKTKEIAGQKRKLLKRVLLVALVIALVLGTAIMVINELPIHWFAHAEVFDNYENFATFMKNGSYQISDGNYYVGKRIITDLEGNVLCEYLHDPNFVSSIKLSDRVDRLPITVYTIYAIQGAENDIAFISAWLLIAIFLECIICAVVYISKSRNIQRQIEKQ